MQSYTTRLQTTYGSIAVDLMKAPVYNYLHVHSIEIKNNVVHEVDNRDLLTGVALCRTEALVTV